MGRRTFIRALCDQLAGTMVFPAETFTGGWSLVGGLASEEARIWFDRTSTGRKMVTRCGLREGCPVTWFTEVSLSARTEL